MKNYLVPIIAVILIVGILGFFAYSTGRNNWFKIGFLGSNKTEKTKDASLPKTAQTPAEKEKPKTSPDSQSKPTTNNQASSQTATNKVQSNGGLIGTGASSTATKTIPVVQTSGIMKQTTTITINGKKTLYYQEVPFSDYQSLYQYQKVTIK